MQSKSQCDCRRLAWTHCGIVLQSWSDSITDVTVRAQENSLHGGAKNRYLYSTFTYAELLHDLFLHGWRVWAPRNTVRGVVVIYTPTIFCSCDVSPSFTIEQSIFIKGSHNKLQRRPLLLSANKTRIWIHSISITSFATFIQHTSQTQYYHHELLRTCLPNAPHFPRWIQQLPPPTASHVTWFFRFWSVQFHVFIELFRLSI